MRDHTLDDSDITFLEDGKFDEAVTLVIRLPDCIGND